MGGALETVELCKVVLTDQLALTHQQKEYSEDGRGGSYSGWGVVGNTRALGGRNTAGQDFFFMGVNLGMN